jgi:hypothetical protein
MRPRQAIAPVLFFLLALVQTAGSSVFRQVTPYFLKPNNLFVGLEYANIGLTGTFINRIEFALDYGINENVQAGFSMPYLLMAGAQDSGVFGDFQAYVKFLLAQSEVLLWRLSMDVFLQLPTGIIREDSYRKTGTATASYYPYSTGTSSFAPSFLFSLYLEQFLACLSATYVSQNLPDENLLNFNVLNDRIDLQLMADYMFKFVFSSDFILYERPSAALQYKLNISPSPVIPDTLLVIVENNLRLNDDWKLKVTFSMPVIAQQGINVYNVAVQIGKYF